MEDEEEKRRDGEKARDAIDLPREYESQQLLGTKIKLTTSIFLISHSIAST